jgi:hypothetical protein
MTRLMLLMLLIMVSLAGAQEAASDLPRFGSTAVRPGGLRGDIYLLEPGTPKLPRFDRLKPAGSIYTTALDVPPTEFSEGFPGVTGRFEWFGIDYTGRFWVERPGEYRFALLSDDGSRLYVDGHLIVNNDGTHAPMSREGHVKLKGGIHRIRVSYFQGPRFHVALQLSIAAPDGDFHIFNTDEFKPPVNPEDWKFGNPAKDLNLPEKKGKQ